MVAVAVVVAVVEEEVMPPLPLCLRSLRAAVQRFRRGPLSHSHMRSEQEKHANHTNKTGAMYNPRLSKCNQINLKLNVYTLSGLQMYTFTFTV